MIIAPSLILKMLHAEKVELSNNKIIIYVYDVRTDELVGVTYNADGTKAI